VDKPACYGPVERRAAGGSGPAIWRISDWRIRSEQPARVTGLGHPVYTPELEPGGHGIVLIDRRIPNMYESSAWKPHSHLGQVVLVTDEIDLNTLSLPHLALLEMGPI
jgi:hypothetical protein